MSRQTEAVILGGGLAGLTLALQLRSKLPDIDILIIDRQNGPAKERIHKVGESMVEISSWYLAEILGLRDHLLKWHLPKFGLRFFMTEGNNSDTSIRPEYGLMNIPRPPQNMNTPIPGVHLTTYNIDRGRLENELYDRCIQSEIKVLRGFNIDNVQIGNPHIVEVSDDSTSFDIQSRWVVDASGKNSILSRQLNLRRFQPHTINASWFRVGNRLDPDILSEDPTFSNRTFPKMRWMSTNHFMGPAYWIWLIPLPDEASSIGIMTDPAIYPFEEIDHFESALKWLQKKEPALAEVIEVSDLLDFKTIKAQSYSSTRTFSADRWALTGDAAFFSDALYSPGGDFIAVGNTLITEMICTDMASDRIGMATQIGFGEQLMNGMFQHYMGLYQGAYDIMGSPLAMLQKVAWDTAVYFGYNVILFRNNRLCDPNFHREIRSQSKQLERLQKRMIGYFKTYDSNGQSMAGKYLDQASIHSVQSLYLSTKDPLGYHELKDQLRLNLEELDRFSRNIEKLVV